MLHITTSHPHPASSPFMRSVHTPSHMPVHTEPRERAGAAGARQVRARQVRGRCAAGAGAAGARHVRARQVRGMCGRGRCAAGAACAGAAGAACAGAPARRPLCTFTHSQAFPTRIDDRRCPQAIRLGESPTWHSFSYTLGGMEPRMYSISGRWAPVVSTGLFDRMGQFAVTRIGQRLGK
jgi:hypothetical protein